MITSTYGVKIPEDGDKGAQVFPALETNIALFRDHNHNGTNTEKIISSNLTKSTVNLDTSSWTAVAGGFGYKQTLTFPGAYTLANCQLRFRVRTGAHQNKFIHPTITPTSLTQVDITVNDSTLDLEVMFI